MDTDKTKDAAEALDVSAGSDGPIQKCEHCDGCGLISFNPNLNPSVFVGSVTCKCKHCGGTGIAEDPNGTDQQRRAPGTKL